EFQHNNVLPKKGLQLTFLRVIICPDPGVSPASFLFNIRAGFMLVVVQLSCRVRVLTLKNVPKPKATGSSPVGRIQKTGGFFANIAYEWQPKSAQGPTSSGFEFENAKFVLVLLE
ncbi:MAG: hypothetical protein ACYTBV_05250, partial [Planctomycetota bacterium]